MSKFHNLDFASLQVRNLEKSKQFYTNVLGFQPVDEERPGAVVFKNNTGAIFAIRNPLQPLPTEGVMGTGVSLWFDTADIDAIFEDVKDSDGKVIAPPQPGPFGRQLMITDPDSYLFVFHEYTGAFHEQS